jgi:hypothetical protein
MFPEMLIQTSVTEGLFDARNITHVFPSFKISCAAPSSLPMLSELLKTVVVEAAQGFLAEALVRHVRIRFASSRESRRSKRFLKE